MIGDTAAIEGTHALIGAGGPLRRFEARCHLTRLRSQIGVALAITWVPILVLGIATEQVTGVRVPLLHDSAMHVRLAIATPLLLFLDRVFPIACSHSAHQLSRDGFIRAADAPRFERLLAQTRRLSEAWLPELALAGTALVLGASTLFVRGGQLRTGLSAADWWYALVALPLFEFLIFRSLWRWAIWVRLLAGVSRFDLDLDATHPDRRGGTSFLRKPSLAYCALLLFAVSAVLSAAWGERFQFATLASFVPVLLAFAVAGVLVAFGPLLLFATQLQRVKIQALDALGGLAARNGRWFREHWMESPGGAALENQEVQSLAAVAATYRETVKQIRLVPFDKKDLLLVLFATLLPIVPSMLVRTPHDEWIAMAGLLFGKGGIP